MGHLTHFNAVLKTSFVARGGGWGAQYFTKTGGARAPRWWHVRCSTRVTGHRSISLERRRPRGGATCRHKIAPRRHDGGRVWRGETARAVFTSALVVRGTYSAPP